MSQHLVAAAVVLIPVATPFLVALYKLLAAQLPTARQAQLQALVSSSVSAAEQIYKNIPGSSTAKRQWVLAHIQSIAGKNVSVSLLEVLLEEAVSALPNPSSHPSTQ